MPAGVFHMYACLIVETYVRVCLFMCLCVYNVEFTRRCVVVVVCRCVCIFVCISRCLCMYVCLYVCMYGVSLCVCVCVCPCQGTCPSLWLKLFLDSVGGWCLPVLSSWSESCLVDSANERDFSLLKSSRCHSYVITSWRDRVCLTEGRFIYDITVTGVIFRCAN